MTFLALVVIGLIVVNFLLGFVPRDRAVPYSKTVIAAATILATLALAIWVLVS